MLDEITLAASPGSLPRRFDLSLAKLAAVSACAAAAMWFLPLVLDTFTVNVLTRSLVYAMLAVTVDLLWGYAGILTFGQAAFFGAGAYAAAIVLTHLGATPALMALAFALALAIPMALGLLVGWLSFYHGSTPLYASVISLVVPIVVTQLVFSGGVWTGSSSGLVGYDTLPLDAERYFQLAGLCLVAIAACAWMFARSDAGKLLVAIRDNEARCAYLGLDTRRIKILLTTALAGVAGLAGFLYANASGVVAPENTGFVFGTEIVIWVALGGRGTILGPILGAIGIDYLSASLSGSLPFLWQLILGSLFVAVIIVLPGGLAALVKRAWRISRPDDDGMLAPTLVSLSRRNANTPVETSRQPSGPLLRVSRLAKSYGNLAVLQDIDLDISRGELVSLVGPNGAGKTTLMRCLSDGTEPFTGEVEIAGHDIRALTPDRVVALGVGRKFQVASVFDSLSVGECLRLARASIAPPSAIRSAATLELPEAAIEILHLTGLDAMLAAPVTLLSHGQKQALELAMIVALEPQLILLDEPTAGLTKAERMTIGAVLRKLTTQLGYTAILVEHDLDFVREISSRIVVLHQGKLVLDGTVSEVVSSEIVKAIYSGGDHA